jgi:hypothetical protein
MGIGLVKSNTFVFAIGILGMLQDGEVFKNEEEYVLVDSGSMPLVISMPHGGTWKADFIPEQDGVKDEDVNSMPMGRQIARHMQALYGRRPYTVALGLHRSRLDCNRDKGHQCPNEFAQQVWDQYHNAIKLAIMECCIRFGGCHLIDLHGTSHYYQNTDPKEFVKYAELGYGLGSLYGAAFEATDDELNRRHPAGAPTFELAGSTTSEIIRGPHSLGHYLEDSAGPVEAVPSDAKPEVPHRRPDQRVNLFYDGSGPSTGPRHAKPNLVTTTQIELPHGIRWNGGQEAAYRSAEFSEYARNMAQGLWNFILHWFGQPQVGSRRICLVKDTALVRETFRQDSDEICLLRPNSQAEKVCRYVEENYDEHGQERIRLITPVRGWALKSVFICEAGQCFTNSMVLLRQHESPLDNQANPKVDPTLDRGVPCRWFQQGMADTTPRLLVVTVDGKTVGWGNSEYFTRLGG